MASRAASRPRPEQPPHSRGRSVSIFKPLISSNASPSKSSPRKASEPAVADADTFSQKLRVSRPNAPIDCSQSNPLQDIRNHDSPADSRPASALKQSSKIASLFNRGRAVSRPALPRDKENTRPEAATPTSTEPLAPPIWAHFATQQPSPDVFMSGNAVEGASSGSSSKPATPPISGASSTLRQSRVKAAVAMYNQKQGATSPTKEAPSLQGEELDSAFEAVLASRNIPENMCQTMRGLDANIKRDFIKNNTTEGSCPSAKESRDEKSSSSIWGRVRAKSSTRGRERALEMDKSDEEQQILSPSKRARSRSRGRIFTLGKGEKSEKSPSKRQRSNSRPRSLMSLKNLSSSSLNSLAVDGSKGAKDQPAAANNDPAEFVAYLKSNQKLEDVLVGKIANLRRLVRNESVAWTDEFIARGGMSALIDLLQRIMTVEWREEHEDALLHELLRTLKGLATTQRALADLAVMGPSLFGDLLRMLFDEERKGPSEFATREIIIWLLFQHLETALPAEKEARAKSILGYMADPSKPEEEQVLDFVADMRQHRPFQVWCTEVTNVTKEVFWIFLHHMNVVSVAPLQSDSNGSYCARHFPKPRPPVPAAPYVGGVEWEATNYMASHLDLLNGLIASLPTKAARNQLRTEIRASGFEKLMGGSLRLCKEKFYGSVHDGLRVWVSAAVEDDWDVEEVRSGTAKASPIKSPGKVSSSPKKTERNEPPKLQLPKFETDEGNGPRRSNDMWI